MLQGKGLFMRQPNKETGRQASNPLPQNGREQVFYNHMGGDYIHTNERVGELKRWLMRKDGARALGKHICSTHSMFIWWGDVTLK